MSARLIATIEAEEPRGKGVEGDPCRIVVVYYDLDGTKLAERDPWAEEHRLGASAAPRPGGDRNG